MLAMGLPVLAQAEDGAAALAPADTGLAAADDGSREAGDIVVTAERRETSIQRTPLAVTAVDAETQRERGVVALRDLVGIAPGLEAPAGPMRGTESTQQLYIRGIGTASPAYYGAVGLYLDDVYIPRMYGNGGIDFPDVERIEILRGPQGTLYGQNTSAGAIKIVSRKPSEETSGWVRGAYGTFDTVELAGYLTGPLADGLSASLAASTRRNDGYVYNETLGRNVRRVNISQYSAKLRYNPDDRLDAVLSINFTRDRSDNGDIIAEGYRDSGPRRTYGNIDPRNSNDALGINLNVSYALNDHLTLRSITAGRGFDYYGPWDFDGRPEDLSGFLLFVNQRQFSQELQLIGDAGRLSYIVGGLFFHEDYEASRPSWFNRNYSGLHSHTDTSNVGLYAQVGYQATDALKLVLGARLHHEWQTFSDYGFATDASFKELSRTWSVSDLKYDNTAFTPRIALEYQATPDIFAYVSVTRGSKSGGYNPLAGALVVAEYPVGPEKVTAYEGGLKTRLLDRRLTFNVAAFYNDFRDYQASVQSPIIDGRPVIGNVVVNAGRAHTYGLEIETIAHLTDTFTLNGNVAILRTKFDKFINPTGNANTDYTGKELTGAPRHSFGVQANWQLPLPTEAELRFNAGLRYVEKSWTDQANTIPTSNQTYVDAAISYTDPTGHWLLSVRGKNLFDKQYVHSRTFDAIANISTVSYAPPRTILGEVRYSF
ncbi:iron complex outermembrane receptor protein [Sphingobium sp. B1D3A]|uniref:Iron complex outermembrane receptor protein n=2 Tax=Sphingobium lignivorans TaxID=2735886 RepID=A0ABR6NH57_9SPHN|nr:iron complex outermembrane receptor protein [Sphingobium lignivorans]